MDARSRFRSMLTMRILFLSQLWPYPPIGGDRIKAYRLIQQLAARHHVHLVAFVDADDAVAEGMTVLRDLCRSVDVVPVAPLGVTRAVRYMFNARPFFLRRYEPRGLRSLLEALPQRYQPEVCHFEQLGFAPYADAFGGIPRVLIYSDSLHVLYEQLSTRHSRWAHRWYYRHETGKIRHFERQVVDQFERSVVVTEFDRRALLEVAPNSDPVVIPCGVDIDLFRPQEEESNTASIVFTGYLDGPVSLDGVQFLLTDILWRVRRRIPHVRVVLAGAHPPEALLQTASQHGVEVYSDVPDLRPLIASGWVYVCPLRLGTGIKTRVLEALAMGKAIVTTSVGLLGIPEARDGSEVLIADDPEAFADGIVRLLADRPMRVGMGGKARALVEQRYSWSEISRRFEQVYEGVTGYGRTTRK